MKPIPPCCRRDCLRREHADEDLIRGCVDEYFDLNRAAKANYMMGKVKSCMLVKPDLEDKKKKYSWTIGVPPNKVIVDVCAKAFQTIYNISHGSVENICREIKKGTMSNDCPYNDSASFPICNKNTVKLIDTMCEEFNIKLNRNMKQVLL